MARHAAEVQTAPPGPARPRALAKVPAMPPVSQMVTLLFLVMAVPAAQEQAMEPILVLELKHVFLRKLNSYRTVHNHNNSAAAACRV